MNNQDLEKRMNDLEKRVAALEGQVQVQPRDFNLIKFTEALNSNLPQYLTGKVDAREGSIISSVLGAITYTLQHASKEL